MVSRHLEFSVVVSVRRKQNEKEAAHERMKVPIESQQKGQPLYWYMT